MRRYRFSISGERGELNALVADPRGPANSHIPEAIGLGFAWRVRSSSARKSMMRWLENPLDSSRTRISLETFNDRYICLVPTVRAAHRGGQVSARDFAMFNVAIDSKLRGCDLVRLGVADVHLGDSIRLRTTIPQQKTDRPVPFESTEPTREALASWLQQRGSRSKDWLFPSRSGLGDHLTTRQHSRLLDCWVALIGRYAPMSDVRRPRPSARSGPPE
jgi:integrase